MPEPIPVTKILVVDDTTANLQFLTKLLSENGYKVYPSSDGELALEFTQSILPDLILLDIKMSGMDGFEVCRRLKSDSRTRTIPIIFISILENENDKVRGFKEGAVDYITKPFQPEEVLARVRIHIRMRELTEHLEQTVVTRTAEINAANEQLQLNAERMETLLKLNQMTGTTKEEIIDFAFDAAVRLTRSKLGFLGFINDDETIMTVHRWSHEVMNECKAGSSQLQFSVKNAGLWAESIRQHQPFIINDYNSPNPLKNGTPEGHIKLTRYMSLPIFANDRIVLVVSVANKSSDYNDTDVRQLTLLMEGLWRLIERKIAEESIRKLSKAIEQSPISIIITDTTGKIEFANKKFFEITGYQKDETIGQNSRFLRSGQTPPEVYKRLWKTITSGEVWRGEFHNRKRNGDLFWESAAITAVKNVEGIITHYVAAKEDITEKKMLEEQIQQAQKMEAIGQLAGGVAHDFNNMLGVILGCAEMAIDMSGNNELLRSALESIMTAAQRSVEITRKLLAFARKQTIQPKILDLNETIEGMLKLLRRLIGEDIELIWNPEGKLPPVKMDSSQIDQILANLCVNAKDAIGGKGKITIETRNVFLNDRFCSTYKDVLPGEYVLLSVNDNGCGMDKKTLEKIFDPFFTTKDIGKGTGLGLSTVYGIVKQNGGFITVSSKPGDGSTFYIYFHCHNEIVETGVTEIAETPLPVGKETILLVEDDDVFLEMVRVILEDCGYVILAFSDPAEALRMISEHNDINLLITDVIMPEINGRDLFKKLTHYCPQLKCLFMSGYTGDIIANQGILDEDIYFIQKPFLKRELINMIRVILDNK